MCGPIGIAQLPHCMPDPSRFRAALVSLRHRGPDARCAAGLPSGAWCWAMRAWSIIDPEARSDQPFHLEGCALFLNGEIYNFRRLRPNWRRWAPASGPAADTETIAAYQHWGADVFRRLQGMFAIALLDQQTGEIHLARDLRQQAALCVAAGGQRLRLRFRDQGAVGSMTWKASSRPWPTPGLGAFRCRWRRATTGSSRSRRVRS